MAITPNRGAKVLKGVLQRLNNNIVTEISEACKKTIQDRVGDKVNKASNVTGSFAKTYHKVTTDKNKRKDVVVGYFTKGYAEMLEKGIDSIYYKINNYPKFVSFTEQPHLKTWVENKSNIKQTTKDAWLKAGGLLVGSPTKRHKNSNKINGTRFGLGKNRWFTNAMIGFSKPFKRKALDNIRKIQIEKNV